MELIDISKHSILYYLTIMTAVICYWLKIHIKHYESLRSGIPKLKTQLQIVKRTCWHLDSSGSSWLKQFLNDDSGNYHNASSTFQQLTCDLKSLLKSPLCKFLSRRFFTIFLVRNIMRSEKKIV